MKGKPNRAERIIAFLESRYPGWVPAIELEPVGGRQAWRTAVSEARAIVKGNGDDIENRTRRSSSRGWLLSEYRLKKHQESERSDRTTISRASQPSDVGERQDLRVNRNETAPSDGHNVNEWGLR